MPKHMPSQAADKLRLLVYDLADLEPEALEQVARCCVQYQHTDDTTQLRDLEQRVNQLVGTTQVGRVAKAYELLTGTSPQHRATG